MDGRKAYVFTVAWGAETNTDDAEGEVVQRSDIVPTREAIEALLPRFTGAIEQVPPRFSAIKIGGERAYDLAREGETVELAARPVEIDRLAVVAHDGNRSVPRSGMRQGHLCALARPRPRPGARLPRPRVGAPAHPRWAVHGSRRRATRALSEAEPGTALHPVATALGELPSVAVSRDAASR
jgi:tRNA pseudouridine55 synthase